MTADMSDLDAALADLPTQGPSLTGAVGRKCRHPRDRRNRIEGGGWVCDCGHIADAAVARRGKQSRNYGNRAELAAARKYGGEKIGAAGGPVDIRGHDWNTQVKTHRRLPPIEWTKAFAAMSASRERLPRLLLRFLPGPGLPPVDYFVIKAEDWLDWHGRDDG